MDAKRLSVKISIELERKEGVDSLLNIQEIPQEVRTKLLRNYDSNLVDEAWQIAKKANFYIVS